MSCVTLTKSRRLACMSSMPGINAIGIAAFDGANKIATTAGGVVDVASVYGASTIARLEVKNTTTRFLENGVSGGDSRSTGVTGNITAIFNVPTGGDIDITLMVEELLKGEVVLFLEKKDGTISVAGANNGAMAITADNDTGATVGELNGFTVTFQTMEPDFSRKYLLAGQGLTDYAAALMAY